MLSIEHIANGWLVRWYKSFVADESQTAIYLYLRDEDLIADMPRLLKKSKKSKVKLLPKSPFSKRTTRHV